jgi:DNA polymerase-1
VKPGLVDSCCTGTWKYEPGAKDAHGRPRVLLPASGYQLNQTFVEEVADAAKDNLVWFSYQHEAVRIGNRHRTWINGQGEQVTVEERCLRPITSTEVESLLDAQVATGFIEKDKLPNGGEVEAFVPCSISPTSANMLINSPILIDALPQIDRLLDVPVPINTGSHWVLPRRDHNVDTRVFLDQDLKLRQMPLQDAKDLLEDISKDFCFADDDGGQSKCHWYARLITPMCRGIMGWEARMPLWTFTANRPRAGKDNLNGVAQTLYYGYAFEDSPLECSKETEKRITAALAAGRRSMHIANQQGSYFDDQALIAAITGTVWCSRRLGSNDSSSSLEYRNELEFSLSANMGLQFREDFIPRCRFIHLAYFEEDPNSRTFSRPDLHGYVRDNRELVLSAVYSLVVEWRRQGCPNGPTPFTTFPRWGQVVGGVMVACGYGDPCRVPSGASTDSNPREEALSELFEIGYEKHQDNWLDSKAVYSLVEGPDHQPGFWNGLESSKDKEEQAKDLKIYNRRTLRGITLYWQDVLKKLCRTKIRFVKAERAARFVPDVPDENRKNLGDVVGDVPKSSSTEGLTTETSPTSPNFTTYAYREGNKYKNILSDDTFIEREAKAGTAGPSGTDKADPTVEIPELPPFLYVSDVARLRQAITLLQRNPGDPLCVDIETYGPKDKQWGPASLDAYRGSIRLLSIKSVDSPVYLIDLDRVMFLDDLKQLLESREWVGHNLSFDLSFLRYRFKVKLKSCFDTMAAARILANGTPEPNDLGSVLELYLGIKLPKNQGSSDWGMTELTAEQLAYAANDVLHLLPLKAEMEKQLEASDLVLTASLENLLVPAVVDINLRGFCVDKAMLEQMLTDAETAKASSEAKLKQALNAPNLNVNSNPQLLNAFAAIGLSLNNTDKKETSKTEYQGHPAVAALIEYRQVKSGYTEKIESLLAAIRPDGRIHTKHEPLGTGTGRFSCHAPNIQQIPNGRKAPIRKAFKAPEGRKLIKLDYNQMELRACASYTGETRLIKAYKDGADVHRLTASTIFGVLPEQVTDAQRSLGKTINFGFVYGMGAEGFARNLKSKENIDLSVERAKSYRDKFFELYPGLSRWHQDCWRQVRTVPQPKESRTPGLRRRLIKGGTDFNKFTDLTDTPIQGGCADAVKMANPRFRSRTAIGNGYCRNAARRVGDRN